MIKTGDKVICISTNKIPKDYKNYAEMNLEIGKEYTVCSTTCYISQYKNYKVLVLDDVDFWHLQSNFKKV